MAKLKERMKLIDEILRTGRAATWKEARDLARAELGEPAHGNWRKPDKKLPYRERNRLVLTLGFVSYQDYLQSPLWQWIREQVFARSIGVCEACKERSATQVHHKNYDIETLRGERLKSLVAVCRQCHEQAEFVDGKKTAIHEANASLKHRK